MSVYQLHAEQIILASLEEVWDFISSPGNLREITPPYMGFEVTSGKLPEKMYPGMIITYKVRPFLGIRMGWVTEITQVEPMKYFVDEQRVGPYSLWHHEHWIEPVENGVLMRDLVTYRLPLGLLGRLAHRFIVKKKLDGIFDYRKEVLEKKYAKSSSTRLSAS